MRRFCSTTKIVSLGVFFLTSFLAHSTRANVGDTYGFGSQTAGRAGASVSEGFNGFAAYTNPAALSFLTQNEGQARRFFISWGLLFMSPQFEPIDQVVIENDFTSDKSPPRTGQVDLDYPNTLGNVLGLGINLFPEFYNLTIGLTTFSPIDPLAQIDSGETYIPEYVLYRARTQRPQAEFGIGAQLTPRFHIGVGLHFVFSLTSKVSTFLQTSEGNTSTMRMTSSLKPRAAPYLGMLYSDTQAGAAPPRWSTGLVIRLPAKSRNEILIQSGAEIASGLSGLDFNLEANSTLFYDPLTLEVGGQFQHSPWGRLFLQLDYQAWNRFEPPALEVKNSTTDGGTQIIESSPPRVTYRNLLIPRIAEEITLGNTTWRIGYAFRKGIFKSLPEGSGNALDPDKHMLNGGVSFRYSSFLGWEVPASLDLHASFHSLVSQSVQKTDSTLIGSPGYESGGNVWGGGLSISLNHP